MVTVPVEGLKSQHCFDELRTSYIRELDRLASHRGETTRTQRLFQLTQLLDYLQSVKDTILLHIEYENTLCCDSISYDMNIILVSDTT